MTATSGDTAIGGGLSPTLHGRGRVSLSAQFLRYLACAGLAGLVNFAVGTLLVDGFALNSAASFPLAVALAYIAGMIVNFLLNRRVTFSSSRTGLAQARTFIVVALSGLALTTAIAGLSRVLLTPLVGDGGLPLGILTPVATPETLSRAMAIGGVAIYSFAAHKYLTFDRGVRRPLGRILRAVRLGGSVGFG